MSYHGLGQSSLYPQTISRAPDPVRHPAASIAPMRMINRNPMLEPAGIKQGDRAMMLEMQARTSRYSRVGRRRPTAALGADFQVTLPKSDDELLQLMIAHFNFILSGQPADPELAAIAKLATEVGKVEILKQAEAMVKNRLAQPAPIVPPDEELFQLMVAHWDRVLTGQQADPELAALAKLAEEQGKGEIVMKAQSMVKSALDKELNAGVAPTSQPAESIVDQGAPVNEPMPSHPIVGQSKPTDPITTYVPETGLDPAQPGVPVEQQLPPPAPPDYQPEGQITQQAPPPEGPISTGTSTTGQISTGTSATGPIPLQIQQQQAAAAAATAAQQQKSPIVPIAIAAGAALLLSRLL